MQLTKRQQNRLHSIIEIARKVLTEAAKAKPAKSQPGKRVAPTRRRGADLVAFKKLIKAERKKGASVAKLAEKYGVTPSYIYQMQEPKPVAKTARKARRKKSTPAVEPIVTTAETEA